MRLFNRLIGGSHNGGANNEENLSRGRNNEGALRAKSDKKRNMTAKKLGLEALEERQLLSVNPLSAPEYDEIREAYANLDLPASMSQINVIAVDDLSSEALQAAINQAAQTQTDDLIVLRTTADNYVVNLESTAVTVNIDSDQYGKLTIVGKGEEILTIETVDVNAFTVLNGDFTIDGAVVFNYSSGDITGDMVFAGPDGKVTLGDQFVVVTQTTKADDSTGELTTSYVVDRAMTPEEVATTGVLNTTSTWVSEYKTEPNPHTDGDDYKTVRDSVDCIMRRQYNYFPDTPGTRYAPRVNSSVIYDAEAADCAGWVGTVANMLAYTGWAQQAGFSQRMNINGETVIYPSVEDAVVAYLRNNFIDTGASGFTAARVLDYLFSGNDENRYGANLSSYTNSVEGGGFFTDIEFGKVGGYVESSDSMLQDLCRALDDGCAVTLEINTNGSREYVSVWGYRYNENSFRLYNSPYDSNNGVPQTVYGLICTNPRTDAYQQLVTDSRYNNQEGNYQTLTHYIEKRSSGSGYDSYHTYLLGGSGANLTLVRRPSAYWSGDNFVNGIEFPEDFCFYGTSQGGTSQIVGFTWLARYEDILPSCEINQSEVLSLESMPGNTENVIYLDFGGTDSFARFSLDNGNGYGVSELRAIEEIWRRVSEDFSPFNVNVTTDSSVWSRASKGVRCLIGGESGTWGAATRNSY